MATHRRSDAEKKMKADLFTADEVSRVLKLKKSDLKRFEEQGLFDYADRWKRKIDARNFERLKVALALKRDLGVNDVGVDVILNMREKMSRMQREFNAFLLTVRHRLGQKIYQDLERIQGREAKSKKKQS